MDRRSRHSLTVPLFAVLASLVAVPAVSATSLWWDGFALPTLNGCARITLTQGADLIVGGEFTQAGAACAPHVVRWDGVRFNPLGDGLPTPCVALVS